MIVRWILNKLIAVCYKKYEQCRQFIPELPYEWFKSWLYGNQS